MRKLANMNFAKSDLWFSELLVKCKRLLQQDKFNPIFTILTRLKLPKYGKVLNAKGQWVKLNQDVQSGKISNEDYALQLIQFRELISELLKEIESAYINESVSFDDSTKNKQLTSTNYDYQVFRPENVSLEEFIDLWLGKGIKPRERQRQLKMMERSVFTWTGTAGSFTKLHKFNPHSELYLIFWPLNDDYFMLDPIIGFFSYEHKQVLMEIERGDKITIRGRLELSDEAPKIALRNSHIVKVQKRGKKK